MATFSGIFDFSLGYFFHLTENQQFNFMFGIFSIAVMVTVMVNLVRSRTIDHREMKRLKDEMSDYQKRAKEAQKKGDTQEFDKVQKAMMERQSTMMVRSFKPMIYTSLPVIMIFRWLRNYRPLSNFMASNGGALVKLPFVLPHWGNHLGWLGWYILCSFSISNLVKILLRVEM
jgi:uncharacterized membrane protein (DUF106 family)